MPTGTPLTDPPLVEMISEDPVLRHTKLIAEAWDCDGLNQVRLAVQKHCCAGGQAAVVDGCRYGGAPVGGRPRFTAVRCLLAG